MNYSFHPHAEKELEEIETHYDILAVMHLHRKPNYWTYRI